MYVMLNILIVVNVPSDSSDQTLLEMASAIIAQVDETTNT